MSVLYKAFFALTALWVVSRVQKFINALRSVDFTPGMRPLISPLNILGASLPTSFWNPGFYWHWEWRKTAYMNHQYDFISMVPLILGSPVYYISSMDVARQLLTNESKIGLIKPEAMTAGLLLWGLNVISANGDVWKRHRKLLVPAFTNNTYTLVLKETIATYREMLTAENWEHKDVFMVNDFNRIPFKLALILISRCGFGLPMSWVEKENDGNLSFADALRIVSESTIVRLLLPYWVYRLPIKRFRHIDKAWKSLAVFMHDFVASRKQEQEVDDARGDVFTRIVSAFDPNAKDGLNEEEVIGNTFALMFAGHETTSHVLSATLGFLAIHQDEQEKAYNEIMATIDDREPTLDDLPKLEHLWSCFLEAGRIFPAAAPIIPRELTQDVVVAVSHPTEKTAVLKKGNQVLIDVLAIHHNPNTFPQPEAYRPARWYGVKEHDWSEFGFGPRACIGRKFAQTEALTFLSLLLREWKFDIVLADGESRQQHEERVMTRNPSMSLSFGVGRLDLKMSRRV